MTGALSVILTLSMLSVVMIAGPIMITVISTLKDVLLTYLCFTYFNSTATTAELPIDWNEQWLLLVGLGISFLGAVH